MVLLSLSCASSGCLCFRVTQMQRTGSAQKSNPVTSNMDGHLSHTLSLPHAVYVFLCQDLSIARSSRQATWHRAGSSLTQETSYTNSHTYTHIAQKHIHPEGMFRCFRPVTEGVSPADRPLSCVATHLLPTHTQTHTFTFSLRYRMTMYICAHTHILIIHTLPAVAGCHKADCVISREDDFLSYRAVTMVLPLSG